MAHGRAWVGHGLLAAAFLFLLSPPVAADTLDDIKKRGELRWATDSQGGGPFIYPDEKNPGNLLGFEVDLAKEIAKELGVKSTIVEGNWVDLPKLVQRGSVDMVMNGYELTPERARDFVCSRPYFVYGLQLMVNRNSDLANWDELRNHTGGKRRTVGILDGSAAAFYIRDHYGKDVDVTSYDNADAAIRQVSQGVIDATLQDDCIAIFYADRIGNVRFLERPVAWGYYVIMCRKGDDTLAAAINQTFEKMLADGRLRTIYDKYDLSGKAQELALRTSLTGVKAAPQRSALEIVQTTIGTLVQAAGVTVMLTIVSFPLAMVVGLIVALGRMYGPWPVRSVMTAYVEVLRGTPLMLQLYAIFFVLPTFELRLPAFAAAVIGLAINYSAYQAEIFRAGLQAIPRGQWEAALALGMTSPQAMRRIILPQAWRIVLPPMTNDFIAMFKDTSVCSVVTVTELTKEYNVLSQTTGQSSSSILVLAAMTAVLYLAMSYPLAIVANWSERRLRRGN